MEDDVYGFFVIRIVTAFEGGRWRLYRERKSVSGLLDAKSQVREDGTPHADSGL